MKISLFGKKYHQQRRRKIVFHPTASKKHCAQQYPVRLLHDTLDKLEQDMRQVRFWHQRSYLEQVNLLYELNKKSLLPGEKIKIHFLFVAYTHWPAVRSVVEACLLDPRIEVKIILLDEQKSWNLSPLRQDTKHDVDRIGLPYIQDSDYALEKEQPHILVYNIPYNEFACAFPRFACDAVKKAGIRPVYLPYGIEYDKSRHRDILDGMHYHHYLHSLAWRVFVMHEDIQDGYFEHCRLGGAHVQALGSPKFDPYVTGDIRPLAPEIQEQARGKKILVYQIHHPSQHDCRYMFRSHSLPVQETLRIIKLLSVQEDFFTLVTLHPLFEAWTVEKGFGSAQDCRVLKQIIQTSPHMGLYAGDYQNLLPHAHAFITEQSSLMIEMAFFNKPVLYLYDEPLSMKKFAEEIVGTFYQGNKRADVERYLGMLRQGRDPKEPERKTVWTKYFSRYDGTVGRQIKEHLLAALAAEAGWV